MSNPLVTRFLVAVGLSLVQFVAAIPWLMVLERGELRVRLRNPKFWGAALGAVLGLGVAIGLLMTIVPSRDAQENFGRLYASVLHAQLAADFCVLVFFVLLLIWPKGAAVGLSAFREGLRQPMFWYILGGAALLLTISPFIPYFTFGEDYLMLKELGFDIVMLAAVLFGVLASSMSISEEIEGRTAITLMSKPVSRRQFLLGKYLGILMAGLVMTSLLGWYFDWVLIYKRWYERTDPVPFPVEITNLLTSLFSSGEGIDVCRGIALWTLDVGEVLPGLVLGFCQLMVLLAIAVALSTRLPMIVNLATCLLVYFLGHLSPVLVEVSQRRLDTDRTGSPVFKMVNFVAQLFDTILPALKNFTAAPTLFTDTQATMAQLYAYVGQVVGYALLYTTIALLFGLILFEDRDLA